MNWDIRLYADVVLFSILLACAGAAFIVLEIVFAGVFMIVTSVANVLYLTYVMGRAGRGIDVSEREIRRIRVRQSLGYRHALLARMLRIKLPAVKGDVLIPGRVNVGMVVDEKQASWSDGIPGDGTVLRECEIRPKSHKLTLSRVSLIDCTFPGRSDDRDSYESVLTRGDCLVEGMDRPQSTLETDGGETVVRRSHLFRVDHSYEGALGSIKVFDSKVRSIITRSGEDRIEGCDAENVYAGRRHGTTIANSRVGHLYIDHTEPVTIDGTIIGSVHIDPLVESGDVELLMRDSDIGLVFVSRVTADGPPVVDFAPKPTVVFEHSGRSLHHYSTKDVFYANGVVARDGVTDADGLPAIAPAIRKAMRDGLLRGDNVEAIRYLLSVEPQPGEAFSEGALAIATTMHPNLED